MKRIKHEKASKGREMRRCSRKVELRMGADGAPSTIVGYGAVFDSWSEDLGGFREIIRPGAFDKTIAESSDVLSRFDHDFRKLLGRTSSGTLRIEVDDVGLRYEVDIPNTSDGRDAAELINRGDVTGSSFEFGTVKDNFSQDGEMVTRELIEVRLYELGPVVNPAYMETSSSLRSLPTASEIPDESALRNLFEAQGLTGEILSGALLEAGVGHGPVSTVPLSILQKRLDLMEIGG